MISIVLGGKLCTKCIRRRQEDDEDRQNAIAEDNNSRAKDRGLRDIQRVQDIPRSLQLMTSSEKSKCGIGDAQWAIKPNFWKASCGAPCPRSGAGPIRHLLGTRGGRTPREEPRPCIRELLRNQLFRSRLSRRWIPSDIFRSRASTEIRRG